MIDERLAEIFRDLLDLGAKQLSEDDLSRETAENWDSLNHLRLVTAVEEAYDIGMTMDEVISIANIADVQKIIDRHTN